MHPYKVEMYIAGWALHYWGHPNFTTHSAVQPEHSAWALLWTQKSTYQELPVLALEEPSKWTPCGDQASRDGTGFWQCDQWM